MTQEELEKEIERLQGELNATGSLLNFFIDAMIRSGDPGLINALRLHVTNMLKAARSLHTSDRSAASLKGFEERQAFFNCRVTNTLKSLNAVNDDDG